MHIYYKMKSMILPFILKSLKAHEKRKNLHSIPLVKFSMRMKNFTAIFIDVITIFSISALMYVDDRWKMHNTGQPQKHLVREPDSMQMLSQPR